ncbi:hypothetical protein TNCV_2653081 [Trichonephila clavipes]|nr:hypothetical protein TNCV_2653081 [Trichonephila clavipes]
MQDNYDQDDEVVTSAVNTFLSSPPSQIEPAKPDEIINFIKNTSSKRPRLFNPNQYGFTNKLSTLHPLLRLTESISEGFKKEEHGSGLSGYPESLRPCLDLGLTFKLITYDISSPLIHLIHSYSLTDPFGSESKKIDLIQLARDLDESPDPSMSKIVLRDLIISSKYYKEEETKELLEVITAERLETEQQQKLKRQEQLSIEKLRLK